MKYSRTKEATLTAKRARELLRYDPTTGVFTWLRREVSCRGDNHFNARYANKRAGVETNRGYRYIQIRSIGYLSESRLAWLYITGSWPSNEIDHINGKPSDNRFSNLREATPSQNKANRKVQSNSRSGIRGVRFRKGKWTASIKRNGKSVHLGSFDSPEMASEAFLKVAKEIHGEFAKL